MDAAADDDPARPAAAGADVSRDLDAAAAQLPEVNLDPDANAAIFRMRDEHKMHSSLAISVDLNRMVSSDFVRALDATGVDELVHRIDAGLWDDHVR